WTPRVLERLGHAWWDSGIGVGANISPIVTNPQPNFSPLCQPGGSYCPTWRSSVHLFFSPFPFLRFLVASFSPGAWELRAGPSVGHPSPRLADGPVRRFWWRDFG